MRGRVHTEEDCRVSRHYDYSVECGCLQVESGVERNREGLLFSGAPTVLAREIISGIRTSKVRAVGASSSTGCLLALRFRFKSPSTKQLLLQIPNMLPGRLARLANDSSFGWQHHNYVIKVLPCLNIPDSEMRTLS
jgi:hypothetical protein